MAFKSISYSMFFICIMQVDLLWRRAVGKHRKGKIYCLVNADLLDYEQADMAEKLLEDRLQEISGNVFSCLYSCVKHNVICQVQWKSPLSLVK